MKMKRNEKILGGIFLLVVVGWFAVPMLLDVVTGSGARLEAQKKALDEELAQLTKLNEWKKTEPGGSRGR